MLGQATVVSMGRGGDKLVAEDDFDFSSVERFAVEDILDDTKRDLTLALRAIRSLCRELATDQPAGSPFTDEVERNLGELCQSEVGRDLLFADPPSEEVTDLFKAVTRAHLHPGASVEALFQSAALGLGCERMFESRVISDGLSWHLRESANGITTLCGEYVQPSWRLEAMRGFYAHYASSASHSFCSDCLETVINKFEPPAPVAIAAAEQSPVKLTPHDVEEFESHNARMLAVTVRNSPEQGRALQVLLSPTISAIHSNQQISSWAAKRLLAIADPKERFETLYAPPFIDDSEGSDDLLMLSEQIKQHYIEDSSFDEEEGFASLPWPTKEELQAAMLIALASVSGKKMDPQIIRSRLCGVLAVDYFPLAAKAFVEAVFQVDVVSEPNSLASVIVSRPLFRQPKK